MAEAILRVKYGDSFQALSAGINPTKLNPIVKKVMAEIGIDMSNHKSKHINLFMDQKIDVVVTVCDFAKENCPFFPGAKQYMHKNFPDPSQFSGSEEEILNNVRMVRDEIIKWIDTEFRLSQRIRKKSINFKVKM